MAKYTGSVFGSISGQQLGVVGANWKGIDYIRKHVIPANPNTVAQQLQRAKFKNMSSFGRRIVDTVLNSYTQPYPKKKSPFNLFMENNVPLQETEEIDYTKILLFKGSLYNASLTPTAPWTQAGDKYVTWPTNLMGEAKADDKAILLAYNSTRDLFSIQPPVAREVGEMNVAIIGSVMDYIQLWLAFASVDGQRVSDSVQTSIMITL
jgi:hypothetical protein